MATFEIDPDIRLARTPPADVLYRREIFQQLKHRAFANRGSSWPMPMS